MEVTFFTIQDICTYERARKWYRRHTPCQVGAHYCDVQVVNGLVVIVVLELQVDVITIRR